MQLEKPDGNEIAGCTATSRSDSQSGCGYGFFPDVGAGGLGGAGGFGGGGTFFRTAASAIDGDLV
ncbi:hypothetical protein [Bradyrhizobium stylosanthis]|uniref:hypothetical protein n=1 Tax=Bradyrhizobium stylosanthis TaxID=1803665 RepID=UPI00119EDD2E|nr:hypothetical protein [Bradyrhizobium stylosanthis]